MSKRQKRHSRRDEHITTLDSAELPPLPRSRPKAKLAPKTEAQRKYISSIRHNKITFGIGPAGVGKTYAAARIAAENMLEKRIEKIYLTRPAVEAGRPIGFLKGTMEEKMAPYIAAYGQGFNDGMGQGHFEYMLKAERIEIVPLNFMQGRSFDEPCIVLADEMQNATVAEMKMLLTRIGDGARMVIDGDPRQIMLPRNVQSGLIDAHKRLCYLDQVDAVEFTRGDIVRSGLVRQILDAYDESEQDSDDQEVQIELPGFITGQQP